MELLDATDDGTNVKIVAPRWEMFNSEGGEGQWNVFWVFGMSTQCQGTVTARAGRDVGARGRHHGW